MPLILIPPKTYSFCKSIQQAGGTAYVSGGSIRDHLLELPCKDLDLEIHNLDAQTLDRILEKYGQSNHVGKSFGVCKMKWDGMEIDISLPKNQNLSDPFMGEKAACQRRDLTINSMLYNPITDQILDFFGGANDIEKRLLKATYPDFFVQDPLRVFRLGQFAGRLNFTLDPKLIELCHTIDIADLPSERIWTELEKGWLKSPKPSIALAAWDSLQALTRYFSVPEFQMDQDWLDAFDRAKEFCNEDNGWNMGLFLGVLLHRFSLAQCEGFFEKIKVQTYLGFPIQKAVLAYFQHHQNIQQTVSPIIQNHAAETFPIAYLATVAHAVAPHSKALLNLEQSRSRGIHQNPLPSLITGNDLLQRGLVGKNIGACFRHIRQLQLDGMIHTRDEAILKIQQYIQSQSKPINN